MKAMILAAGLGTRLLPLTDERPKALVMVAGRTLLEIVLARLRAFGVREVIVNAHHYAEMIIEYLKANDHFGMRIEVSREETLLDTGGGLKKAAWFFLEEVASAQEPFILHNDHVFEAANVELLSAALPDDERPAFGYDARSIDWWDYWINVHVPALRKWCYPLIEGRQLEARPKRSVPFAGQSDANASQVAGAGKLISS